MAKGERYVLSRDRWAPRNDKAMDAFSRIARILDRLSRADQARVVRALMLVMQIAEARD